jgi:hypothetical protein
MKENLVLRLKVMIEPALGQLERGRHIVHGSAIVSLLLKETGSSAQDFLSRFLTSLVARFNGSFAKHHQRWYRGMGSGLYYLRFSKTSRHLAHRLSS